MNPRRLRLLKEARPLWAPCCVSFLLGLFSVFRPDSNPLVREGLGPLGLFIGVPLLAALPFGTEFQYGTLSLQLTHPRNRVELWIEKLFPSLIAVLPVALIYHLSWQTFDSEFRPMMIVWVIAVSASGVFWTMTARSTIGSVVLNAGINVFLLVVITSFSRMWIPAFSPVLDNYFAVTVLTLCYASGMLWLGCRALLRFQLTGVSTSDDLFVAGERFIPIASPRFSASPAAAVSNLIRKELRLLRPTWILTLLVFLAWVSVAMSHSVPGLTSNIPLHAAQIVFGMTVIFTAMIPIFTGGIALGEERTSGTHAWHLTLPISPARQWSIKLVIVLFVSCVCTVVIPVSVLIFFGWLSKSPFMFVDPRAVPGMLLAAAVLGFASFWAACVVNGTIRAVLLTFAGLIALLLIGEMGGWLGNQFTNIFYPKLEHLFGLSFVNGLAYNSITSWQFHSIRAEGVLELLVFTPVVVLAAIQSYHLFRKQLRDSNWLTIRRVLPLSIATLLISFVLTSFNDSAFQARSQIRSMMQEINDALMTLPAVGKIDSQHPVQLNANDLTADPSFSPESRRWLKNATVTVSVDQPPAYIPGLVVNLALLHRPDSWRVAVVHFSDGLQCTESFPAERKASRLFRFDDCK